jgi:hypothetical protein
MRLTEIPQVGDILVATWCYEQTNKDFFQVTRLKNNTIWIRHLQSKQEEKMDEQGIASMTGYATPLKGKFEGAEMRKKIRIHPEYGVLINAGDSYGYLDKWSGEPEYYTAYG